MQDTGNPDTGKYLIFLQRNENYKSYNMINLLKYENIIDMRDYDLKNEKQKEFVKKKINVYATNYKEKNDNESKRKNKILDEMVNPKIQNNLKHFLIDFDGKNDIVLLDIVNDFDDSRNYILIPIEIDSKGNYIINHTYNIPKQNYTTDFASRNNLIQGFQSNLIKNVNFDDQKMFNAIKGDIESKTKTVSSENVENIEFSDDSNYGFCGYSLEKVDNMIRITSDCFENIIPKIEVNNKFFPENTEQLIMPRNNTTPRKKYFSQNTTKKNKLPNSPAKSDSGITSNRVVNNNRRNVSSAPLQTQIKQKPAKTNKNSK